MLVPSAPHRFLDRVTLVEIQGQVIVEPPRGGPGPFGSRCRSRLRSDLAFGAPVDWFPRHTSLRQTQVQNTEWHTFSGRPEEVRAVLSATSASPATPKACRVAASALESKSGAPKSPQPVKTARKRSTRATKKDTQRNLEQASGRYLAHVCASLRELLAALTAGQRPTR